MNINFCAFRKKQRCETQLTIVINDLDKGGQVDIFILDFEKYFDTPTHEFLKFKLYGYGIGGKTLKWIDSFLRQQHVVVNGVTKRGFLHSIGYLNCTNNIRLELLLILAHARLPNYQKLLTSCLTTIKKYVIKSL